MNRIENEETRKLLDEAEANGKKYILLPKDGKDGGLFRIMACRDFGIVKKGDVGGCVQSEDCLSHDGNCWIGYYAKVYDMAKVKDNAIVDKCCELHNNAEVSGDARVIGHVFMYENSKVCEKAVVSESVELRDNAVVKGTAHVTGHAFIIDNAEISGDVVVCGRLSSGTTPRFTAMRGSVDSRWSVVKPRSSVVLVCTTRRRCSERRRSMTTDACSAKPK